MCIFIGKIDNEQETAQEAQKRRCCVFEWQICKGGKDLGYSGSCDKDLNRSK